MEQTTTRRKRDKDEIETKLYCYKFKRKKIREVCFRGLLWRAIVSASLHYQASKTSPLKNVRFWTQVARSPTLKYWNMRFLLASNQFSSRQKSDGVAMTSAWVYQRILIWRLYGDLLWSRQPGRNRTKT